MKNILIALVCTIILVSVCFIILASLGATKEAAIQASGSVASVFVAVHSLLQKRGDKGMPVSMSKTIVQINHFGLTWYKMLVYGTIIVFSISSFGAFTSGAIGGFIGLPLDYSLKMSMLYMVLFTLGVLYFVGRWIGVKCLEFGLGVVILISILHSAIANFMNWHFENDTTWSVFFGEQKRSLWFLSVIIVGGSVIRFFPIAIGYWQGRQSRLSVYFRYLIHRVPKETTDTLIDIAYDEACSLVKQKKK
jgi:hypothetical protein